MWLSHPGMLMSLSDRLSRPEKPMWLSHQRWETACDWES